METKPTPAARRQAAVVAALTPVFFDSVKTMNNALTDWAAKIELAPASPAAEFIFEESLTAIQSTTQTLKSFRNAVKLAGVPIDGEA